MQESKTEQIWCVQQYKFSSNAHLLLSILASAIQDQVTKLSKYKSENTL
jgi:hypothetical protein